MFVKAGLLSLLLLLASRLLGVVRETALAAAFGSTAAADLAVLLLTLPDWLAGVLAGGALAWVLLPAWAQQPVRQRNGTQRRVARRLLGLALALAAAICVAQAPLAALLLPGAPPALLPAARLALVWSALALPAAMLAGLWAARLQHERDFAGLYGANLVVNGVLIAALVALGAYGVQGAADGAVAGTDRAGGVSGVGPGAVSLLGASVLAAMLLRLLWQRWRLKPVYDPDGSRASADSEWDARRAAQPMAAGMAKQRNAAEGESEFGASGRGTQTGPVKAQSAAVACAAASVCNADGARFCAPGGRGGFALTLPDRTKGHLRGPGWVVYRFLRALLPWRYGRRLQAPAQPANQSATQPVPGASTPPLTPPRTASLTPLPAAPATALAPAPLPGWRVWLWAALAAGLPLTLPFAARTLASGAGAGALANFNYAWKLVELPLVLAIQLVAALAFPAIAQAHAQTLAAGAADAGTGTGVDADADALTQAVRGALVLAWTLACAAAAALLAGAPALAALLFGWGRMQAPALAQIAAWGSAGAWGLLPQALLAVALTLLASQRRLRAAVLAYALALALLLAAAAAGYTAGGQLMWALNAGFLLAALTAWGALGAAALRRWLPLRTLLAPLLALLAVAALVHWFGSAPGPAIGAAAAAPAATLRAIGGQQMGQLALCALAAAAVLACGWFCGPHLRQALR